MAIKRLTIELDDSPDRAGQTKVPEGARVAETKDFKAREMTGLPTEKESEETQSPETARANPRAPGRTSSDLFAEFVNQPRAMATLLIFAPVPFFAMKIQSFGDLIYPVAVGILLNVVWFGIPWITNHWKKRGDT
ncbi:MAG: hypothetical protein C4528_06320 [Gammaproteobacteria bacterium]|nr:MAG: hypothetical protein C4528_06320 [Gammaproteobacteria bacterium]